MQVPFFFCTINKFQSKFHPQSCYSNWTIPDLLLFLRCLPLQYNILDKKNKEGDEYYYIIHDDNGPIFNVYFSNNNCNIEIIISILRTPEVPISKVFQNLGYCQVTNLYKKISQTNFTVEIYRFFFNLNLYMLG